MQPEQAQEPTSRLDALEHQINADHDPETGEVLDEGRSEEDTGEGPDLATAIADIDAAEIVVGVNSRLAEYEAHFTRDELDELRNAAAVRPHELSGKRVPSTTKPTNQEERPGGTKRDSKVR